MTSFVDARKEVPPGDRQPDDKRIQQTGIRDLLRDTALLVTTLSQGGKPESVMVLRQRCQHLMAQFSAALEQRGVAADVRDDAIYAQCGLLDEAVLRALPMDDKPRWDAQPLQVERFGKHDAGERVFERLTERMREAAPNADLLECYAAILGLGFMGRYASPRGTSSGASEGQAQRTSLLASLDAQLQALRPAATRTLIADRRDKRLADWFYRLSPWAIAGLACVAAALVYLIWSHVLDTQLAHLTPSLSGRR
ncbi:type IV secretion protein DotU [Burkholderia sp. WAC0059]|uniref:DotU family type IV/VI secretion system protein n=1 Tax=Burkholderia sp. WAC0059 TaxID=2066022 RepID=UPI000C7E8AE0|nr:DotU family type IV/VI secretion system protein [Burkholderia sp. WAC0059]PLZ04038.1 type IV secretion protein DotU [Burkholderia sp. WAC0059]